MDRNSATITGVYHAGQNTSQTIAVAVEKQLGQCHSWQTWHNYISVQNKLFSGCFDAKTTSRCDLSGSLELHCDAAGR